MAERHRKIKVVGLPCNGYPLPEELTEEINSADVLAGGRKNIELFPEASGKKISLTSSIDSFLERIRSEYEREKKIIVLATGDPMIFGPVKNLLKVFDPGQIEIVSAVSPLQRALAGLREDIEDSVILSFHGRKKTNPDQADSTLGKIFYFSKAIIYTDMKNNPGAIAGKLMDMDSNTMTWDAAVCEKLGRKDENIVRTTVGNLVEKDFNHPNILVIFNPRPRLMKSPGNFGLPDDSFQRKRGMITHPEIRAVTLSKLRLSGASVMWDVGAGSGSVGIEANQLYGLKVYLVEKNGERFEDLVRNCRVFGSENLVPVRGDILSVAGRLPDPDRVFIGGGGDKLIEIFNLCYRRLRPGGIVVCNAITLDSVSALYLHVKGNNYPFNVHTISVSGKAPIKNQNYLKAENAITIFDVLKNKTIP